MRAYEFSDQIQNLFKNFYCIKKFNFKTISKKNSKIIIKENNVVYILKEQIQNLALLEYFLKNEKILNKKNTFMVKIYFSKEFEINETLTDLEIEQMIEFSLKYKKLLKISEVYLENYEVELIANERVIIFNENTLIIYSIRRDKIQKMNFKKFKLLKFCSYEFEEKNKIYFIALQENKNLYILEFNLDEKEKEKFSLKRKKFMGNFQMNLLNYVILKKSQEIKIFVLKNKGILFLFEEKLLFFDFNNEIIKKISNFSTNFDKKFIVYENLLLICENNEKLINYLEINEYENLSAEGFSNKFHIIKKLPNAKIFKEKADFSTKIFFSILLSKYNFCLNIKNILKTLFLDFFEKENYFSFFIILKYLLIIYNYEIDFICKKIWESLPVFIINEKISSIDFKEEILYFLDENFEYWINWKEFYPKINLFFLFIFLIGKKIKKFDYLTELIFMNDNMDVSIKERLLKLLTF